MRDTVTRYQITITFVEPVPAAASHADAQHAAIVAADLHIQLLLAADPDLQCILAAEHITMQIGLSQVPRDVPDR